MFKAMTLNLWNYHDWDKRFPNITTLINKEMPDCIALQEVQTNHAFADVPQTDLIGDACGYKYRVFAPTLARKHARDREGNHTQRASYGQGFLSKHPIVITESYFLDLYDEHPEENTVLFCRVEIKDHAIDFCDIHLANNAKFSELHLAELMALIAKRQTSPIIIGDFNIWVQDMKLLAPALLKNYTVSSAVTQYQSMPSDNNTLDYVALPSYKYKFSMIVCPDDYVSDHRALLTTVEIL